MSGAENNNPFFPGAGGNGTGNNGSDAGNGGQNTPDAGGTFDPGDNPSWPPPNNGGDGDDNVPPFGGGDGDGDNPSWPPPNNGGDGDDDVPPFGGGDGDDDPPEGGDGDDDVPPTQPPPSQSCLCKTDPPRSLTSSKGPFRTATLRASTGTIHYPTQGEPPFAAVAIVPGFTNTGPEMADWGAFYASWGIVTAVTNTGGGDFPAIRAQKLMAAIEEMKKLNADSGSPLGGKLAGRFGTSGYSMGGGGTTITARDNPNVVMTSVGLAAWSPTGQNVKVPTLLMCGTSDGVAACSQSQGAYNQIPATTPKMLIAISGATHFSWFGPTGAGRGVSGQYALAFQKVFLESDERWRPLLLSSSSGAQVTTNIK